MRLIHMHISTLEVIFNPGYSYKKIVIYNNLDLMLIIRIIPILSYPIYIYLYVLTASA